MVVEVIVFALVLVMAQLAVSIGMLCLMFSNWFLKRAMRKSVEMVNMIEEMEDEL